MADRLSEIRNLERIREIRALESMDPNQPSVQAIGELDGKTPAGGEKDIYDDAAEFGGQAMEFAKRHPVVALATHPTVGKVLGYAGGLTRTGLAKAIGMVTPGRNPVDMNDIVNTLKGEAPGVGDYAERFGVKDVPIPLPFEKHNHLTTKGLFNLLGNIVTDPLYHGAGQAMGRRLYGQALEPIELEGIRRSKHEVGDVLNKHGVWNERNLQGKAQAIVDKNMESVRAAETAAAAAGGEVNIVEAMKEAQANVNRIKKHARPGSAQERMANEMQAEIDNHLQAAAKEPQTQTIFEPQAPSRPYETGREPLSKHGPGMGVIDRVDTTDPLIMRNGKPVRGISKVRPTIDTTPVRLPPPSGAEAGIVDLKATGKTGQIGRADIPEITPLKPTGEITPFERPDTASAADRVRSLPVGGKYTTTTTERVPGPNPEATAQWKRDAYSTAKDAAYDTAKRTTAWQAHYKSMGFGLKEATEKAIEKTLGKEAALKYMLENEEAGKLLSTAKSQTKVANQRARDTNTLTSTSNTEALLGALAHASGKGLESVGLSKLLRGVKMSRMPIGYALRNTPQAPVTAGVVGTNLLTPWARPEEQK